MKKTLFVPLVIFLLVPPLFAGVLFSCAGLSVHNQYDAFKLASEQFTSLVNNYNDWYKAATPEIQAKWKEKVDPLIEEAARILNAWEAALESGGDTTDFIIQFEALKRQILMEIAKERSK